MQTLNNDYVISKYKFNTIKEFIKHSITVLDTNAKQCQTFLEKKNDLGENKLLNDAMLLIPYNRGELNGLIMGRDRIINILNLLEK